MAKREKKAPAKINRVAVEKLTKWTTAIPELDYGVGYGHDDKANPVIHDGTLYVSLFSPSVVAALNPVSGELLWSHKFDGYGGEAIAYGEGLLISNHVSSIGALDAKTGRKVWVYKSKKIPKGGYICCPQVELNEVYFGEYPGFVTCLDLRTGSVKWQRRVSQVDANFSPPLILSDRLIFAHADQGAIAVDKTSGEVLWQVPLGSYHGSKPLLFDDETLVVVGKGVYFLSPKDGRLIQKIDVGDFYISSISCHSNRVFVVATNSDSSIEDEDYFFERFLLEVGRKGVINVRVLEDSPARYVRYYPEYKILCLNDFSGWYLLNPDSLETLTEVTHDGRRGYSGYPLLTDTFIYGVELQNEVYCWRRPKI